MKRFYSLILILISAIALPSCSPQFSSGGWIIPVFLWGGMGFFAWKYNKTKDKAYETAYFFCLIFAVIVTFVMLADLW
jgi:hypothetical protein